LHVDAIVLQEDLAKQGGSPHADGDPAAETHLDAGRELRECRTLGSRNSRCFEHPFV
jgi:hypothetical protein